MNKPDILNVTILDNGDFKIETGPVSQPNHLSAESFLREAAKLAGGTVKITHKHGHSTHTHEHEHEKHGH